MWFLHNEWAIMSVGRWEPSAVSEHLSLSAVCSSLPLIHRKVTLSLLDPRRDWADSSVLQSTPSENRAGRVRGEGGPITTGPYLLSPGNSSHLFKLVSLSVTASPPLPPLPPPLLPTHCLCLPHSFFLSFLHLIAETVSSAVILFSSFSSLFAAVFCFPRL